jgi:subtilisin family serine protease
MGRIILAIPNTPAGEAARRHLFNNAQAEFGAKFESTLGEVLLSESKARDLPFLDAALDHTYVLLTTAEGAEFQTIGQILDFHNNSNARTGDTHGFVERGDIDRPMEPALTPPSSPRVGAPLDLTAPANHADYLALLNVSAAHARGVKGGGVSVAVVDTGIDASVTPSPVGIKEYHDVVNNLHYTRPRHRPPSTFSDPNGHGSAMALIIAETSPDAELCVIKICDDDPQLWDAMAGLGQALYAGTQVICFAFGFKSTKNTCCTCGASGKTQSDVFKLLIDNIAALDPMSGLKIEPPIIVAPTGNESSARGFLYPSAYDSVLAVGSVDTSKSRSLFSNYGTLHSAYLMAPGGQEDTAKTVTEYAGEGPTGAKFFGTSPAVAYASAMLALLRSDRRFTYTNRAAFVDHILNKCSPKPTNVNQQKEYGAGFISW